jgi:hypothetical protein
MDSAISARTTGAAAKASNTGTIRKDIRISFF